MKQRLDSDQCSDDKRTEEWLWADVRTKTAWKSEAPDTLSAREKTVWAKEQFETHLASHLEKIDAVLAPGTAFSVEEQAGEVRFLAAGIPLATVYLDEAEAPFLAGQWRQVARATNVTDKFRAKTLVKALMSLRKTDNDALRDQVVRIDTDVLAFDAEISKAEVDMNTFIYRLYELTDEEVRLVRAG